MQLITMDVEETVEKKTLRNGLVDNMKTEETANGQSKISEKENNETIKNLKPLEPEQPDKGNGKSIEDVKESVANQDDREVLNTKDIHSDIVTEKQNGESTTKTKESEVSQTDKDIDFNQENKCNNSDEEYKENNTELAEEPEEDDELKVATPEVPLEEIAREDNNGDISTEKEADINESKTVTNDTTEEAIITENSVTSEQSFKTDEIIIQQTENIVDPPNDGVDVVDAGSIENKAQKNEVETKSTKDFKNDSLPERADAMETATSNEDEKKEVYNDIDIQNEVAMDTASLTGDETKEVQNDIQKEVALVTATLTGHETKEGHNDIDVQKEVPIVTATLTGDETKEVHKDIDIQKEVAIDTDTAMSYDAEKSDPTGESIKHGVGDKEESIDTDISMNTGLNQCEATEEISYDTEKPDPTGECMKHCVSNKEESLDTDNSINTGLNQCGTTEEIKKLSDSHNEDSMETDTSISNNIDSNKTQNIVVPDSENVMDTATSNIDKIGNPEATEETNKEDISLVEEAMVTESTIADKLTEDKSYEKSEITDSPAHDVGMEITEKGSIQPKHELNGDSKECSIPDRAENERNESVENIDEEALLGSPSHKTDLKDDDCVPTTKDVSAEHFDPDDNVDYVQVKNPALDITEDLPEKEPLANVMSSEKKIESNSETEVKDNDDENSKDEKTVKEVEEQVKTRITSKLSGLSNTLDILSDDDEDTSDKVQPPIESGSKCIDIEDDDDVMLIDEDSSSKESKSDDQPIVAEHNENIQDDAVPKSDYFADTEENQDKNPLETELSDKTDDVIDVPEDMETEKLDICEKPIETVKIPRVQDKRPIIPSKFLKTFKTNVEKMTREELEEFCLLKIVEAVVDRTNLGDIKTRLKTMHQQMEEWKKKSAALSKQNRDLQIVLKTVQEEQKKKTDGPITPLKITRSVGMQVYMAENLAFSGNRRKSHPKVNKYPQTPAPSQKQNKPASPQIPVPRLVPATNNSPAKTVRQSPQLQNSAISSNSGKTGSPMQNGLKSSPATKPAEKRPFSAVQSVTVDLTDDEPPPKVAAPTRNPPAPSVRMVPQQQLMARPQFNQNSNSPRKVYIPINSQTPPVIRAGQTLMLKTVPPPGPRLRGAAPMVRIPQNAGSRGPRLGNIPRHPAPLPDVPKQQQPPNWKSLPPAPDLKISKVENGIVISWKIDGFTEVNFEEIASYQLYAYQETSSPPNTLLWKKIGDVKALPLPMACTLTQFMAGYKYYFAVRAVDVRSRIGPFSLPGSILLLNNK